MDAEQTRTPLRRLRQFMRDPIEPATSSAGPCELCGEGLAERHRHLWEKATHTIHCVCTACSLLMSREGAGAGKYLVVPERYLLLEDFELSDSAWNELLIPVNMAFLIRTGTGHDQRLAAFYPGPAGATESLLDESQWQPLLHANPVLTDMQPEVEALLIQRIMAPYCYYLVPIDSCYQLVGLIRRTWRGLSGGATVWQSINTYFETIQAKATVWKSAPIVEQEEQAPKREQDHAPGMLARTCEQGVQAPKREQDHAPGMLARTCEQGVQGDGSPSAGVWGVPTNSPPTPCRRRRQC